MTSLNSITEIEKILENYGLKKTRLRRNMILIFLETRKPITQSELITLLSKKNNNIDRVSIYRNLLNLKEYGIIHEVDYNKYIYCSHKCDLHAHLLLFCQKCQRHKEIKNHEQINSFMNALSKFNFLGKEQPIFLRGVCKTCS